MYPIDVACLNPESAAPCDLYKRAEPEDYVFFAQKGISLTDLVKETLRENGTSQLFIHESDLETYLSFANTELAQLVKNPAVNDRAKAEAVYATCHTLIRYVYEDPRALFIASAADLVGPTVDLILSNDYATRHLVKLTAYDHKTYVHSTNVGIFSVALAGILFGSGSSHDLKKLGLGFFLHDLGKCKIPLEIINKNGPLDRQERQIVNRHPEDGSVLLMETGQSTEEAQIIILQHHERDDGTGYPYGLRGADIHPYARICRLADVYEALTSERPYHKRRTTFEALKLMKEEMKDLDPQLINCFCRLFV